MGQTTCKLLYTDRCSAQMKLLRATLEQELPSFTVATGKRDENSSRSYYSSKYGTYPLGHVQGDNYHIRYEILSVRECVCPSWKMFALPGNGLNFEACSFTEWVLGYQWVLLKACGHLLDYKHKKVNHRLYKRAVRTWGAYMSQPVDVERA